jgi:endonuclease YncB( thermonuclease family)
MRPPPLGLCLPCRFLGAPDGNTIVVTLPGLHRQWTIRLANCRVPGLNTPQGRRAQDFLRNCLADEEGLRLFVPAPGNLRSMLVELLGPKPIRAHLFLADGRDVGEWMVRGQLARPTRRGEQDRPEGEIDL